jgi:hypothetical protein
MKMSKLLKKVLFVAAVALSVPTIAPQLARADGCYICGGGSSEACKNYCRYRGEDTFGARKECEKRGCKVTGTGSCPTAVNYKVCMAPPQTPIDSTVAAVPGCSPPRG